jgi:hypothetical protein
MTMIAIEHPEAMRKHASRIEKRKIRRHAGTDMPALKRKKPSGFLHFKGNSEAARRLRAAQLIRMSVKERKAAAKRAAEVRWARHRAKLRAVRSLAS